jgi:PKD repeat protein
MSDKEASAPAEAKKRFGWLKALFGGIGGLVSGAIMMYASPLVDKFVKPAKPVANFEQMHDGATVTFHNRTSGASEGWWDFGDGSALEPFSPQQDVLAHTYQSPGDYSAKLSVRNLLGDESERSVTLHVESTQASAPSIEALTVTPMSPQAYAPATFHVTCKVKNAQACVWDAGDGRPFEIVTDSLDKQDRVFTYDSPGGYEIRVAAINGTRADTHSEIAQVGVCPRGMVTAVLLTTDQATRVETLSPSYTFCETFPQHAKDDKYHFEHDAPARPGYEITDVRLVTANGPGQGLQGKADMAFDPPTDCRGVSNLHLQLAADHRSVRLTGDMVKEGSIGQRNAPLPHLMVPVVLIQQKKSPAARAPVPVASALTAPGSAILSMPPVPAEWVDTKRQTQLELQIDGHSVWHDSKLPRNAPVALPAGRFLLTATVVNNNQVRVDLVKPSGVGAAGN